MKSKKWIQRNSQDIYVKKAKNEGYVSRSAFKLLEIENKFNFIICESSTTNNIKEVYKKCFIALRLTR